MRAGYAARMNKTCAFKQKVYDTHAQETYDSKLPATTDQDRLQR